MESVVQATYLPLTNNHLRQALRRPIPWQNTSIFILRRTCCIRAHHFAPLPNPPWTRIPVSAPAYDYAYTYSHPPTSTPVTNSSPPSPTSSFWSAPGMYDEDSVPGVNPPEGLRDGIRYLYPSKKHNDPRRLQRRPYVEKQQWRRPFPFLHLHSPMLP